MRLLTFSVRQCSYFADGIMTVLEENKNKIVINFSLNGHRLEYMFHVKFNFCGYRHQCDADFAMKDQFNLNFKRTKIPIEKQSRLIIIIILIEEAMM